ncbi:serine/threonine-protein phosphatase PP1 isozyme 1-like isoform X2 [Varroa jacobsoni]|uniref:protein-serine/threonine phosphatase n=1 Tax=Varroa destructor TaxID=109461 RepID=A0A7M7JTC9_VARDE|nr:serine/threonine-protein phosphatase PP1 isozyme 1-like isoform X2 [Varroa destructor]XP_022710590.1 serine/threonine-protein phosphatase PP1 isozyme 1-like isoform X2 [Varroa jacobsoni]
MANVPVLDVTRVKNLIKILIDFGRTNLLISELKRDDIEYILDLGTDVLNKDESLICLQGPVMICGGLFGDLRNFLNLLDTAGMPPKTTYVVLGDIVNKGKNSIEVVCLLYCFKVLYPNKHFILRGEQESTDRVRKGGFKTEVKYRFDGDLYKKFVTSFSYLPLAAVIADKVLACHGGINSKVRTIDSIRSLERPLKSLNGAAAGVVLGVPINKVFQFLEANKLNLICRTQWAPAGYKYMDNRTVLNVISTRNFCGKNNPAAMVKIDKFGQLDIILCGDDIEPEKTTHVPKGRRTE